MTILSNQASLPKLLNLIIFIYLLWQLPNLAKLHVFPKFPKMKKLLMFLSQSSFIKPSLEICLVSPKEGIVTLRVAGLAVSGFKGLSTMVRRPTYAVLSRNQFCRELRAHGRGVAKK